MLDPQWSVESQSWTKGGWRGIDWEAVARSSLEVSESDRKGGFDLLNEVINFSKRSIFAARFSLPICADPMYQARALHDHVMPVALPLMCGQRREDGKRNPDDVNRFMHALVSLRQLEATYGKWRKATNHDFQGVPSQYDQNHSYENQGITHWNLWLGTQPPVNSCGTSDDEHLCTPTILLDRHGCPKHDSDGNVERYAADDSEL